MGSHPNRSSARDKAGATPLPMHLRAARDAAGLTQTAAAALVHTSCRVWQQWEAGDRRMHPAFWELFRLKTDHADDDALNQG